MMFKMFPAQLINSLQQIKCYWTTQQYKSDLNEAQVCNCISAKLGKAHSSNLIKDN